MDVGLFQLEKSSQPACITKDLCVKIHGRESRPTPRRYVHINFVSLDTCVWCMVTNDSCVCVQVIAEYAHGTESNC